MSAAVIASVALVPLMVSAWSIQQDPSQNGDDVDPKLTFDVASVKPTDLGPESMLYSFRSERLTLRWVTLQTMVRQAYGLSNYEVVTFSAPLWIDTDHFDVLATAPGIRNSPNGTFPLPVRTMLRNLLEDRFHLKAHFESKELPVFALVLAKPNGTLGRGLRRRTVPCTPGAVAPPLRTPRSSDRQICGGNIGPGFLTGRGATLPNITSMFSGFAPGTRLVIDRTALTGTFDVDLFWTPDNPIVVGEQVVSPFDRNAPSLFTAIQEQLGLKLESTRAPVDVLVIDHVEAPTPN